MPTEPTITITPETADRALLALLEAMSEARRSRLQAMERAGMSFLPPPILMQSRAQAAYWGDQFHRDEVAYGELCRLRMGLEPADQTRGAA